MKCNNRASRLSPLLAFACAALSSVAGELVPDSEKNSYLPLIPESSYTYNFVFKDRKGADTLVLKSFTRSGVEMFYFIRESEANNPPAILAATSFGGGVYLKQEDGIATLVCYDKSTLNKITLQNATLILKKVPEPGQSFTVPLFGGDLQHIYRVAGFEDVTVPAGTFKGCLKIQIDEKKVRKPPEADTVSSGFVWLAKGIGVVKWQRVTGRVDELVAYKLAPMQTAPK